ncbi:MAG: response regulator [Treponema sp.]|nr:response regulator [Candidatus Treponema merdequi]
MESVNQKVDREAFCRQEAVISSLAIEYDYVACVNMKAHDVILYRVSKLFETLYNEIDPSLSEDERLRMFFKQVVYEEDWPGFQRSVEDEKIKSELSVCPSYEVFFRIKISDELYYYKLRFTASEADPDSVVVGLISFDEQTRAQIRHKEDADARSLIEKQFEVLITERTSEIQSKNKALNRINEDIIELLGDVTEARDAESGQHIRRVKGFTHILAEQVMRDWPEYKLTQNKVELITSASALHDIGKITIPDAILLKPGRLTPEEFDIMKMHSINGCGILQRAPKDWSEAYLTTSMEICRSHHEKWDGRGYPDGLKGNQIPISAQIVSVADCYDALTAKRVYKDAFSPDKACNMILGGECGAFSDMILQSFEKSRDKFVDYFNRGLSGLKTSISVGINAERLAGVRILLVEDNEMSRLIAREMLEGEGATVIEAKTGPEALDMFNAVVAGTFNAILMDVIMPGMSGPDVAKAIRQIDSPHARAIPIIALTSSTDEKDVRDCFLSGMNSYLTKPVKISSLTDALLSLIN